MQPVASSTGAEPATAEGESLDFVRNPYSPIGGGAAGAGGGGAGGGRAALYTNLAVVHALQGNCKQAEEYVAQALTQQSDCRQALLCSCYLELRNGHTEAAVELLKKHRRVK